MKMVGSVVCIVHSIGKVFCESAKVCGKCPDPVPFRVCLLSGDLLPRDYNHLIIGRAPNSENYVIENLSYPALIELFCF